jgi:hypothetical protein
LESLRGIHALHIGGDCWNITDKMKAFADLRDVLTLLALDKNRGVSSVATAKRVLGNIPCYAQAAMETE